jgi:hypothetical protein
MSKKGNDYTGEALAHAKEVVPHWWLLEKPWGPY